MGLLIGVDEAGRGPVIGSLVICVATCDRKFEKQLNALCKKDSKQLTPQKRVEILKQLEFFCTFYTSVVDARLLTELMDSMSLTDIEAKYMAQLLGNKKGDIMIDLPDRYDWVFKKRMERFGVTRYEAEHKADENHPIVAAASIKAKVLRDSGIEKIKNEVGIDFGSGYPGDEKVRNALMDKIICAKLHSHIRHKWKTLDSIKQTKLVLE